MKNQYEIKALPVWNLPTSGIEFPSFHKRFIYSVLQKSKIDLEIVWKKAIRSGEKEVRYDIYKHFALSIGKYMSLFLLNAAFYWSSGNKKVISYKKDVHKRTLLFGNGQ